MNRAGIEGNRPPPDGHRTHFIVEAGQQDTDGVAGDRVADTRVSSSEAETMMSRFPARPMATARTQLS